MIFNLALCLGVIAASAAQQPTESTQKSKDLDIQDLLSVDERLVVMKRTHTNQTPFRCQTALKGNGGNVTSGYTFLLKARNGTDSEDEYVYSIVNVTLLPLNGSRGYKATYRDHGMTRYNLTLKQKDSNGTCFVVWVEKSTNQAGCELVVPASKTNNTIPATCEEYYTRNCTGASLELYKPDCRYDKPDRNRKSVANALATGC